MEAKTGVDEGAANQRRTSGEQPLRIKANVMGPETLRPQRERPQPMDAVGTEGGADDISLDHILANGQLAPIAR